MDAKENYIRALTYSDPAYVPYPGQGFDVGVQFDGNFRHAEWTDAWGVGWLVTLAEFVPFPKVSPLASLDRLDDYVIPDPGRLQIGAVQSRMALEGGVDSHLLVVGTPEQVRQETLRVLGILAPGGGYVLGPDQGMPWPQANWEAMIATAKQYGRYPLDFPDEADPGNHGCGATTL